MAMTKINLLFPVTLLLFSTTLRGSSPFRVNMVKFYRNPSPIFPWRCCGHHLVKKTPPPPPPQRGPGYPSPSMRQKTICGLERKKSPFLWRLIDSKCGTNGSDFAEGGYYSQESKHVPISTYRLVEITHNWPRDPISQLKSQCPHPWAYWKEWFIETQRQLKVVL